MHLYRGFLPWRAKTKRCATGQKQNISFLLRCVVQMKIVQVTVIQCFFFQSCFWWPPALHVSNVSLPPHSDQLVIKSDNDPLI